MSCYNTTLLRNLRKIAVAVLLAAQAIFFATQILAPPPTPHSIAGFIFESDGVTQVQLGTPYSINDTNSADYVKGETNIPVPELTGRYSETINGSDGDTIILLAWNASHYGNRTIALLGDMDNVNITINTSRMAEANVTIITPSNHTAYNVSAYFNITANISIMGAAGTGCNATISFGNTDVLNISNLDSFNHSLGNIPLGNSSLSSWNVSAQGAINTTVTVTSVCGNSGTNLERVDFAGIYNITVLDNQSPIVTLISPANNSFLQINNITFNYNVTEHSRITNCSLLINNLVNATNSSAVEKAKTQNITQYLANANYNWTIRCLDFAGNAGNGTNFNLTVNLTPPSVTDMRLTIPVNLLAASNATVWCNATVNKLAGNEVNISRVNATFFDNIAATHTSPNDNNDHYTNASCTNLTLPGDTADYGCAFPVWYYANNASWMCNLTATDTRNLTGFSSITTTVNELVALSTGGLLDFGALAPTNTSNGTNLTLSNQGNKNINVSVRGYAVLPAGDNLSMTCGQDGNISVTAERHSAFFNINYDEMANLTNQSSMIANFTLYQKTNDAQNGSEFNQTFWKVRAPTGVGGSCNGTIVVAASIA